MNLFDGTCSFVSNGFTVLMAVYLKDDPVLFEMAVESVFNNSLRPDQVVIVADGELSLEIEDILVKLSGKYKNQIDLFRLSKNMGLAFALNEGLKHVKYPWVIRADSDDYNIPSRFYSLAKFISANPSLSLVGSAILEVDSNRVAVAVRRTPNSEIAIRQMAKYRNPFNHMSVAFKLEAVLACGGYPNIYLREDYALWCRMISHDFHIANMSDILVHVSGGKSMYERRGGVRYAISEFQMQSFIVECGLQNKISSYLIGCLRCLIFLTPSSIRGLIYINFLRSEK